MKRFRLLAVMTLVACTQFGNPDENQAKAAVAAQTIRPLSRHPDIGIATGNVSPQTAGNLKLPDKRGALVVIVKPSSPADRAGIIHGDVVRDLNGAVITNTTSLLQAAKTISRGQSVPVIVWRDGKEIPLTIKF
jgi:S1-C subfamily serine protease